MSDTKKSNAAIACGDMKLKDDGKGIIIDQGNYGPSKNEINQLAGMEIKFDEEYRKKLEKEAEEGLENLYNKAKELGCNKIALGHHLDDVIETVLMGMLYGAQMQTMMPKLHSTFHEGMELIRPLYYVKEADIINWKQKNELEFIQCACRFTEHCTMCDNGGGGSKREEMKKLINKLRQTYKNIDMNILRSTQNVNLDTLISYRKDGKTHHFLDDYDKKRERM